MYMLGFLFVAFFVHATDYAEFVNLGFSNDSKYFMFSQYGHVDDDIFAELIVVDVEKNRYAPSGYFYEQFSGPFPVGQTGQGAMLTTLANNNGLRNRYNIDHVETGRIIYFSLLDNPKSDIQFRDTVTNTQYSVLLTQSNIQATSSIESSFSIELTTTHPEGGQRFFKIGEPHRYRENVQEYSIQQIITSEDNRTLVFLIAMKKNVAGKISFRYMVETVVIR